MYSSGRRGRTRNAIGLRGRVGSNPTISVKMKRQFSPEGCRFFNLNGNVFLSDLTDIKKSQ